VKVEELIQRATGGLKLDSHSLFRPSLVGMGSSLLLNNSPRPTSGTIVGARSNQTPSRAKHGPDGVWIFWKTARAICGRPGVLYGTR